MEFKPKDWVLVRDDENDEWRLNIFSHKDGDNSFWCVSSWYAQCIPFEGNEHLLGKKDAPEEKKTGGWKVGDKVEVRYCGDDKWYTGIIIKIDPEHTSFVNGEKYPYRVAASCFHDSFKSSRWCSRGQLREPIEKPESAKEWRPEKGEVVEALVNDEWQAATLILDDHTDFAPYRVCLQNGDKTWCTEEQVRPAQNEPFKFGDKVEIRKGVEWREAVVIEIDHSDIPYKVATADGDIHWRRKEDVRRA